MRRGGTLSLSGVYGGAASPMPLLQLFDKQITVRQGQANVRRWIDDIMPLLSGDDDPLGVDTYATHRVPLEQAPHAYEIFQKKQDGCVQGRAEALAASAQAAVSVADRGGRLRDRAEHVARRDRKQPCGRRGGMRVVVLAGPQRPVLGAVGRRPPAVRRDGAEEDD